MPNKFNLRSWRAAAGLALLAMSACVVEATDSPPAEPTDAPSTGQRTVPVYSYDHQVLIVPPVAVPPSVVINIEGKETNSMEYAGSVGVPVVNRQTHATGTARVTADPQFKKLRVLFESVPLPVNTASINNHSLCVYVDRFRFDSASNAAAPRSEDHGFCVNLQTGEKITLVGTAVGPAQGWAPVPTVTPLTPLQQLLCRIFPNLSYCSVRGTPAPLQWKVAIDQIADSAPASVANNYASARVEFELPLGGLTRPEDLDPNPDGDHFPGIGLAFAIHNPSTGTSAAGPNPGLLGTSAGQSSSVVGGYPDAVGVGPSAGTTPTPTLTSFGFYRTVLFGKPAGIPLKVMSWNVKRFTGFMSAIEPDTAFQDEFVPPAEVGRFLAEYDIVGIQEGWDTGEVHEILVAANLRRAELGLDLYRLYGPIDWGPGKFLPEAAEKAGVKLFDETHGGVWIMSRFPAFVNKQGKVFDDCRGEDCLKAKGVLWVRLWLGAPPAGCQGRCDAYGGEFIDVYNMHLNAEDTLCDSEAARIAAKAAIDGAMGGAIGLIVGAMKEILTDEFNCSKWEDPAAARQAQLKQAGAYIRATADPERPAIIMGDFNVTSGRNISGREYRHLLHYFDVSNDLPDPGAVDGIDTWSDPASTVYNDYMTPWVKPYGWDWNVDHADSFRNALPWEDDGARQKALQKEAPAAPESEAEASFLGAGGGEIWDRESYVASGVEKRRSATSTEDRFDYIFFRQPQKVHLDKGAKVFPKFAIARIPGEPVSQFVWPYPDVADPYAYWFDPLTQSQGKRLRRLSDHMAAVAVFEYAPLYEPPVFHPTWQHDLELRVTSAATNDGDCYSCGDSDMYTVMWSFEQSAASQKWIQTSGEVGSTVCDDQDRVSYTVDACMAGWFRHVQQSVASSGVVLTRSLGGTFQLWEDDGGSGAAIDTNEDDEITTISPGDHPRIDIDFIDSKMGISGNGGVRPSNAPVPYTLKDNEPISYCGNYQYDTMCIRAKWTELIK